MKSLPFVLALALAAASFAPASAAPAQGPGAQCFSVADSLRLRRIEQDIAHWDFVLIHSTDAAQTAQANRELGKLKKEQATLRAREYRCKNPDRPRGG